MSEPINQQHTSSKRKARQSLKQAKKLSASLQLPEADDHNAWSTYWKAQSQPWRTEPEIDDRRQKFLANCRSIVPEIEHGIYPMKDIQLNRADVEWLLATHENGRGLVDWNIENQREREGLDLRGADLRQVDLSGLPLARMHAGLTIEEAEMTTDESAARAAILMDGANLSEAHLEEAHLYKAHLEGTNFSKAFLRGADMHGAHLEHADLTEAHLEKANLSQAYLTEVVLFGASLIGAFFFYSQMEGANLTLAHLKEAKLGSANLEGANLDNAHLERAYLFKANLENAKLYQAHLEGANLSYANLEGANLYGAHLENALLCESCLEGANLTGVYLEKTDLAGVALSNEQQIGPQLADTYWNNVHLVVMNWSQVEMLGDEYKAYQKEAQGKVKDAATRLNEYETAVRANRQISIALQTQGLNEDATRFAYRAQKLQRIVLRRQRKFLRYLFSGFLDLFAGYGYKPQNAVLVYLLVIGMFAVIYYHLGPHLAWNEAIVISMTAFHGRGFFPDQFKPGDPQALVAAIEALVGLLVELTLIATLTQRLFGK